MLAWVFYSLKLKVFYEESIFGNYFSLMSFGSIAAIIAPNAPKFLYLLGWVYIILMLGVGVLTIYSERIMAWCDKNWEIGKMSKYGVSLALKYIRSSVSNGELYLLI
ncbi:hypothetical protein D1115_22515 (plasmid) [Vibrio alfacsensis]|uniref:Uncharacterized protein n=1 Tax=Vibrio alfacsensis TaxID=1074311 RepID=A0ABM6Z0G2_9VIBR|nr:hypothetical protein D1115_22515 [Vibrio alfacsensis]